MFERIEIVSWEENKILIGVLLNCVAFFRRTRKSARKTERKKWSLKEGSAHEEFALVEALAKLIQQVEDTKSKT